MSKFHVRREGATGQLRWEVTEHGKGFTGLPHGTFPFHAKAQAVKKAKDLAKGSRGQKELVARAGRGHLPSYSQGAPFAKGAPGRWITVSGHHVFVED